MSFTFSSKEADKMMSSNAGPSKVILPGNIVARILDIKLDVPPYDTNAFNLVLSAETQPIGEGFEGLLIDKDMPELGNYAGQFARIQTQQYAYTDYTNKEGKTTTKEEMIFRWVWNFAKELGVTQAMIDHDVKGESIQEFIENAKAFLVSKDRWIHFCVGGSEYENKAGYTQYRLFVVKPEKGKSGYELYTEGKATSKLIKFDESQHVKKKKAAESVGSFSGRDAGADLDLE